MWWGRYILTARSMEKKSRPSSTGSLSWGRVRGCGGVLEREYTAHEVLDGNTAVGGGLEAL
jgi:hypothetical protein